MQLVDVVGIVTGAAGGFGRSFAEAILKAGGRVVLTDINEATLQKTGEEFAAQYTSEYVAWTPQDVTDRASFHRVFEFTAKHFDRAVNLLVNNAGIQGDAAFYSEDASLGWEPLVEVDLISVIRGTQVGIQQMREHLQGQPGVIINIASMAGLLGLVRTPQYTAAKHGVVGLTRACGPLQQAFNVRVAALCPSFAKTAIGEFAKAHIPAAIEATGGMLEVSSVTEGFVKLVQEDDNAGKCLALSNLKTEYVTFPYDVVL